MKHFKAVHVDSGKEIFFGLEDIYATICMNRLDLRIMQKGLGKSVASTELFASGTSDYSASENYNDVDLDKWLKDYKLYYLHEGEYYEYE